MTKFFSEQDGPNPWKNGSQSKGCNSSGMFIAEANLAAEIIPPTLLGQQLSRTGFGSWDSGRMSEAAPEQDTSDDCVCRVWSLVENPEPDVFHLPGQTFHSYLLD